MPRNLRLLQIDDDLLEFRRASPFVEVVSIVNGWLTSIDFWNSFDRTQLMDLVTADVRFSADATTPLQMLRRSDNGQSSGEFLVPTGLSHAKPFAAIARAAGRPLGVAVHTADVHGWRTRLTSSDIAAQVMACLAAHEIGELAAILGYQLGFANKLNDDRVEACWAWLSDRTYGTFDEAWRHAIQNFRESLVRSAFKARSRSNNSALSDEFKSGLICVLPDEWARLAAWCERMKRSGQEAALGDDDPGFSFLLPDGTRDSISFRSLFADAHMSLDSSADLDSDTLPVRCFTASSGPEPWKLDNDGYPQIAAFLMEFKDLATAYQQATAVLKDFPAHVQATSKLGDILSTASCGSSASLARFLAVLFQLIRKDHSIIESWEICYQSHAWDGELAQFSGEKIDSDAASLGQIVQIAYGCAKSFPDGFSAEELLSKYNQEVRKNPVSLDTIRCCIRVLISLGRMFYRGEDDQYDLNEWRSVSGIVPPVLAVFPEGLMASDDPRSQEIGPFLRDVFGYGGPRPNDGQIGRFVADALGCDAKRGREFLHEFQDGVSPIWVKESCRVYATNELLWPFSDSWPRSLR